MKKTILAPWDCEELIPKWHDLDEDKLQKLEYFTLRGARQGYGGNAWEVISVPPILITENNFILNGQHRAFIAATSGLKLEACVIRNENDLQYHTPKEALRDTSVEDMIGLLNMANTRISSVNANGIYSVEDLICKYKQKSRKLLERSIQRGDLENMTMEYCHMNWILRRTP